MERTKCPSLEYLLKRNQLRWIGHVVRMPDSRLPKQLLYGELSSGRPSIGDGASNIKHLKKASYRMVVLGKFLLRKFHLGKFHLENSSYGKFLLRCFGATLFRSWLASLAVGLRTLVSQVRAQRHSRIACYIVFRHRKMFRKIKFASLFYSYVVSELARFARGRIEDSSITGSRSTAFQNCLLHCFSA